MGEAAWNDCDGWSTVQHGARFCIIYRRDQSFVLVRYRGWERLDEHPIEAADIAEAKRQADAVLGIDRSRKAPEPPEETGTCLRCGAPAKTYAAIGWCEPCLRKPRAEFRYTPNSWDQPTAANVALLESAVAVARERSARSYEKRGSSGSATAARTTTRTGAARDTATTRKTASESSGKR